jgi:hypothetical protein
MVIWGSNIYAEHGNLQIWAFDVVVADVLIGTS